MERLTLDANEKTALVSALNNYLDGHGMDQEDEDEPVIEGILSRLS